MKPFECLGDDGRIYLHQDNWRRWRDERLSVHPGEGKWRFDLQLEHPCTELEMVPVTNQRVHAHGGGFSNHTCFYECSDWSTIYGSHLFHVNDERRLIFRMIVESQNPEPLWGKRITLLSSSSYFKTDHWGHNPSNQFAYFRGQYWQITFSELLHHEFPFGVGYPIRDGQGGFGIPRRGGRSPLVGYAVNQILDTGYFYTPHIPLTNTPVVIDTETLAARQGVLARYGRRLLQENPELYGNLRIGPLGTSWSFPQPEFKLDWRKYGF